MSAPDWKPVLLTSQGDDVRCGYATRAAIAVVEQLPPEHARRLAAMALTCFESPWSDRLRDLLRGVACLLGRLPDDARAR